VCLAGPRTTFRVTTCRELVPELDEVVVVRLELLATGAGFMSCALAVAAMGTVVSAAASAAIAIRFMRSLLDLRARRQNAIGLAAINHRGHPPVP